MFKHVATMPAHVFNSIAIAMISAILRSCLLISLFLHSATALAADPLSGFMLPDSGCDPAKQSCIPGATPANCKGTQCFSTLEDQAKFEKENNCKFGTDNFCGGKPLDKETQCCGKNETTGADKIQTKQATTENSNFDWATFRKQCPNMKQSEGVADGLWSQCKVGQLHAADDDWPVREKVKNPSNPNARDYCIDGCSTPPNIVTSLYRSGVFIFNNKDNPTGAGPRGFGEGSSFYGACSNHDICYQTCNSTSRSTCDNNLLADMQAACNRVPVDHITTFTNNLGFQDNENTRQKCHSAANTMHTGLRVGGGSAFNKRRQQYCQCC
ncbi:MAG: hypothetical protein Q7V00_13165 [Sulfurimicrobium sp.]|nr:hypothetical protein [Sulfurimicrobium sp.]MDP1705845.1 hypothetical protein [Sulfurimicrobium sp.]MDP3687444.1 hypothetical protein [Sulfurimicrobium sp.]